MNSLPVASGQWPDRASASRRRQRATGNRQLAIALLVLLIAQSLSACPVCFGDPNSQMVKSTNNGVLFMLGVIGFVQLAFLGLFVTFWRRARALRRRRESFRVLDGGAQ